MSGESQRAKWVSIMQAWWGPQKVCVCVSVKLCVCRDRTRVLGVHGYWEVQGWNCSVNARCLREIWCVRGILFGCDLVCVCVCVCGLRWEDGGTPVECLHPSNLIYNSAPWRSVRSFSRSPPPRSLSLHWRWRQVFHGTFHRLSPSIHPHLTLPLQRPPAAVSSGPVNFTEWRCCEHTKCGMFSAVLHPPWVHIVSLNSGLYFCV